MTDPNVCRVCGATLGDPALDLAAPALTTTNENLDAPTRIYICDVCAHVQSPEPPDLAAYYDTNYKISLDSEEHDQLYEMRDGAPVYRTDRQAAPRRPRPCRRYWRVDPICHHTSSTSATITGRSGRRG